jgi:hypothetical protein
MDKNVQEGKRDSPSFHDFLVFEDVSSGSYRMRWTTDHGREN